MAAPGLFVVRGSFLNLSIVLNEHFDEDGALFFREACKLGCEGIVSKRLGSPHRAVRRIGSRSRIRKRPLSDARPKRIGEAEHPIIAGAGYAR